MDMERFERIAARFERRSRSSPRAYRALITGLGALGFAVVGATVFGTVALLVLLAAGVVLARNLVLLKLAVPVGFTAVVLLRAVWVKLERPGGERLRPAQAPALFAELERLRRLGRVPRIHAVRVDASLNAGVAQTPRLGILGWPHNDLVLGLPLMLSLSPESFQAVLAHELGHLSGRHGRAGAWTFRVRTTWLRLLEALDGRRSLLARPLRAFFRWYGPYFGAASLALAREQEREADRFSASAAGPRAAADALAAVAVASWAVDHRFWPAMNRRTAAEAEPPAGYLGALEAAVHEALRDPAAGRALERALRRRSRGVDTHPALAERIAALGQAPRLPPAVFQTAAARFLGGALPALRAALDGGWSGAVRERWAAAHAQKAEQAARLAELARAAAEGPLGPDAAWERASLTEDLGDVPGAIALAREAVALHPDHAPSRYGLGRLLIEQDEAEGVPLVEQAIALDGDAELPGAQLLAAYHLSTGRHDLAAPWMARAEALEGLHDRAAAERAQVLATDALDPHGLPPEAVEALVAAVRRHPRVKRLYLARKRLRHLPDRAPVFVLAVEPRWTWRQFATGNAEASLPQALANALPDQPHTFVFVRGGSSRVLFRRIRKLAGARVA